MDTDYTRIDKNQLYGFCNRIMAKYLCQVYDRNDKKKVKIVFPNKKIGFLFFSWLK